MNILDDLKSQFKSGDVTTKLIFWNIALFIGRFLFFGLLNLVGFKINYMSYVSLSSNPADLFWKPWSLLTYAFFHADFFHILFNLVVLNFVGRLFLTFFTQKQFLGLYILAAIFAGIGFIVGFYVLGMNAPIIGASAAIMAILFAVTTYSPLMNVRLLLIGNVKLWHIAAVYLVIDLMNMQLENTGGHISHLAGGLFGFIFIQLLKNGIDLSKIVTAIIDFFANLFTKSPSTPFKKVHKNYVKPAEKQQSKIITKDKNQQQIDVILDKISQSGYDSLSKIEKEFLFKAGK
jgi:membrane associated rhomboid family serine protease